MAKFYQTQFVTCEHNFNIMIINQESNKRRKLCCYDSGKIFKGKVREIRLIKPIK